MKLIIVIICALAAITASEKYSTNNDDIDIEALIQDDAEFKSFLDCFNNKIPCKPIPAEFKKDLAEAIRETCRKCTDPQKVQMKRFLENTKAKYPDEYQLFSKTYDPDSKYLAPLEAYLDQP